MADDKKKEVTDAKDKAEKPKVEAPAKKDDGKVSAMSDKLSETESALAKAKATIAKLKAAAAAKPAEKEEKEEEKPAKKEKKEEKEEEEEAAPKKKVKGGSVDVEEESTKHAVVVSAKAKLSGNIKEAEDNGSSDSKDGKKTIVTATAKHNRETVLEQSVPINHVASVEKVDAAPPAEEKETKDGMKKPTVVARGSLVQ